MSGIFRGAGSGSGGGGDVTGPASSTDNAVVRFDGATGKIIQNSTATLSDAGLLSTASLNLTSALDIPYGGTGQTTQTAAFDALSPTTAKGSIIVHNGSDNVELAVGIDGQVLTANSAEATGLEWTSAGAGDVTAAANLSDNTIIRGDGGLKGVQDSGITIDDSDVVSGVTQLNVDNLRLDGNTISSTDANGNINLTPNGSGVIAGTQLTLTTALDETYGGTAQTTYTTGDILYASGSNTLSKLAISAVEDSVLQVTNGVPAWNQIQGIDVFEIYEEFVFQSNVWTLTATGAGTASTTQVSGESGHPGIWRGETGTDTTGFALVRSYFETMIPTGGELKVTWIVKSGPNLSDGTDTYTVRFGLDDSNSGSIGNDGIWFSYTHSENSGNWTTYTRNAGSSTTNDSGVAYTVDTWYNLTFVLNSAGNSCEFFINGTSVATHVANITSNTCGFKGLIVKSAGTTERVVYADMFKIRQVLNTPR